MPDRGIVNARCDVAHLGLGLAPERKGVRMLAGLIDRGIGVVTEIDADSLRTIRPELRCKHADATVALAQIPNPLLLHNLSPRGCS